MEIVLNVCLTFLFRSVTVAQAVLESYCVCLIPLPFPSLLKWRLESSFLHSVLLKVKYILGIRPVSNFIFQQAWSSLCSLLGAAGCSVRVPAQLCRWWLQGASGCIRSKPAYCMGCPTATFPGQPFTRELWEVKRISFPKVLS